MNDRTWRIPPEAHTGPSPPVSGMKESEGSIPGAMIASPAGASVKTTHEAACRAFGSS
jgi:hypothetical protein